MRLSDCCICGSSRVCFLLTRYNSIFSLLAYSTTQRISKDFKSSRGMPYLQPTARAGDVQTRRYSFEMRTYRIKQSENKNSPRYAAHRARNVRSLVIFANIP